MSKDLTRQQESSNILGGKNPLTDGMIEAKNIKGLTNPIFCNSIQQLFQALPWR
jgi:hypothetical protein